jgi:hypothetical protein
MGHPWRPRRVCVEAVNDGSREARGACGTVLSAERGLLVAHYRGPSDAIRLLGLTPDTSSQVELRAGGQATRIVPVTNNAWTTAVPADTSSIAGRDIAGTASSSAGAS